MPYPTLSVVLPNYNHGAFIADALEALATQSRPPDEIIVIDDGSTDDSVAVIFKTIERHSSIRLLQNEKNLGAHVASARGRKEATGEFIYFAAADDRALPGLFEAAILLMEANPDAGVCTGRALDIDDQGMEGALIASPKVLETAGFIPPDQALAQLRAHGDWFMCNTAVYRRNILKDLGWFDPKLGSYTDSFLCSVIALRHGVCFSPTPLGAIRRGKSTYSSTMTGNIDSAFDMFNYAKTQMLNKYEDLFPADYIPLWESRWRYAVAAGLIRHDKASRQVMERLLGTRISLLDSLILSMTSSTMGIQKILRTLYLFLRLTPGDFFQALHRRFQGKTKGGMQPPKGE